MHIHLNLPETRRGDWAIESFEENGLQYQRLMQQQTVIMVNTPDIVANFVDFLSQAHGSVLINGLGIGMCCQHLLQKDSLTDLTVIENEAAIVELIAPHFTHDPRVSIIHGNAFTYQPPEGKTYDYVWHDIWRLYAAKNLKDMHELFTKYEGIAKWQGAWNRKACLEIAKKENSVYLKYA